ncbi:MAG: hypothetical protein O3B01_18150 [Planctomycetota bacterium]|nr:hypothetical protein [Planctomycetota bacterium]MDA1140497.1 hypothetical protein [Planctomycetota bacterium]
MSDVWNFEPELLESLDNGVVGILGSQKPNGQFGTEPWICNDQNDLFPLAVAWSLEESAHHYSDRVLEAILLGGDALIEDADDNAMWTFRKKDHSTWGQIHQPWTYSRWIRAYYLTRDAFAPDDRERWDNFLQFAFTRIAEENLARLHNIPAHHAMALYFAGKLFNREEWLSQSREFLHRVVDSQTPDGWWAEHAGPVVMYNFVYVESLGTYYSISKDEYVLPSLERAATYHSNFVYPDGSMVETIDGRNSWHAGVRVGNPGLTHTAKGRGFLKQQHAHQIAGGKNFSADYAASILFHGAEGELAPTPSGLIEHTYRMSDDALVVRQGPWFYVLSAYCAPIPTNRWGQDRQNFVSVFHDKIGLIVGGGNTKLQPMWSTFTVGETSLLSHTPGDHSPDFVPEIPLFYVPTEGRLAPDVSHVSFNYGEEVCSVSVEIESDTELNLIFEATTNSGMPVEAHITLIPHQAQTLSGSSAADISLTEEQANHEVTWMEHAGWRLELPEGASFLWPTYPHNPYRKGGEAFLDEALISVRIPFSKENARQIVKLVVSDLS